MYDHKQEICSLHYLNPSIPRTSQIQTQSRSTKRSIGHLFWSGTLMAMKARQDLESSLWRGCRSHVHLLPPRLQRAFPPTLKHWLVPWHFNMPAVWLWTCHCLSSNLLVLNGMWDKIPRCCLLIVLNNMLVEHWTECPAHYKHLMNFSNGPW